MSNKPLLKWTSHPFREFPILSVFLLIFMVALAWILWQITVVNWEMPIFYFIGIFAFFFSLITYFIPTTYNLYEHKIEVFYWFVRIERRYEDFGCYYIDKKGVMLSTFTQPRRLDPFRGLSLRFTREKNEKEELLEILERKIGNKQ